MTHRPNNGPPSDEHVEATRERSGWRYSSLVRERPAARHDDNDDGRSVARNIVLGVLLGLIAMGIVFVILFGHALVVHRWFW